MSTSALPLTFSSDIDQLDIDFIYQSITTSYWATGRSRKEVETCIQHSLNFGLFYSGKQIGYARVLTDFVHLAYLLDVIVEEQYRGKGMGSQLMEHILSTPSLQHVHIWRLGTDDAQGFYEQFGFRRVENEGKMMERKQ